MKAGVWKTMLLLSDSFGKDKYRCTFWITCQESENVDLEDGRIAVFLNTYGRKIR